MWTNRPGSEEKANEIVLQLLPLGCSKKQFDAY